MNRRSRVILVSVMDWGLGHASRTSCIVSRLIARGDVVVIAGSGQSLTLLAADHPAARTEHLPSFSPSISGGRWLWLRIALQVPLFLFSIVREYVLTQRIVRRHGVQAILSDNRYGVRSALCPSYFITHQLRPRVESWAPQFLESAVAHILALFIRRFDGCLVPDVALQGLSGRLSAPIASLRPHAIGVLSRLADVEPDSALMDQDVEWLGIASGPDPGRQRFVESLQASFAHKHGLRIVLCAHPSQSDIVVDGNGVELWPHATPRQLKALMLKARHICCRSGYSTIMDLYALRRSASMSPTPGQAEQEYLCQHLAPHGVFDPTGL